MPTAGRDKNNCPPFLSTVGGGGGVTVGDGEGPYPNLTKLPNFNTINNTLNEEQTMSVSCMYSIKEWIITLNLLQRAKESKKQSVENFSGFRKIQAQRDTKDIGQTGNSTGTIDLAIRQIRHGIERNKQENKIIILLDPNIYHLIERLKRRKFRLKKAIRKSKHPINSPPPR